MCMGNQPVFFVLICEFYVVAHCLCCHCLLCAPKELLSVVVYEHDCFWYQHQV